MKAAILWLAQGLGVGRFPFAPGTVGSLLGFAWFLALVAPGSLAICAAGMMVSLPLSVFACGEAERTLRQKDPGSVVLDEVIAVPFCFAGWLGWELATHGRMPTPGYFLSGRVWLITLAVLVLFRVFDVLKPWPVHQVQSLPGGWGVTADDVLAAVYVNLALGLGWIGFKGLLAG